MQVKCLSIGKSGGKNPSTAMTVECFGDMSKYKIGGWYEIRLPRRTIAQNKALWGMARWAVEEGGAKGSGHFSPEGLVADWKAFKGIPSTSDLDTPEFSLAIEEFGLFLVEFLGLDMSPYYAMLEAMK